MLDQIVGALKALWQAVMDHSVVSAVGAVIGLVAVLFGKSIGDSLLSVWNSLLELLKLK